LAEIFSAQNVLLSGLLVIRKDTDVEDVILDSLYFSTLILRTPN